MNRLKSSPTRRAVAGLALAALVTLPVRGDAPKGAIERPTKEVIAARSGAAPLALPFNNPKVAPGRVVWHPTFAAACAAARKSAKPVLLFQMMGKLDDQFC